MKEVRLEARIRNNILWHAIFDRYDSVAAFCKEHTLHETEVGKLLNLKIALYKKNGDYRDICHKLSAITGILTEDLFPAKLYAEGVVSAIVIECETQALDAGRQKEMLLLPSENENPEDGISRAELREALERELPKLNKRQQIVLRMRFGLAPYEREYTLEEIGNHLEATHERIRQIEAHALRDLRRTSQRALKQFAET